MTNRIMALVVALGLVFGATAVTASRDTSVLMTQSDAATPVAGNATPSPRDDVAIGDTVVFVSEEGDDLANITVDEVINPYADFAEFFTPQEGLTFIAIGITIENLDADDDAFQFLTFYTGIQTGDGLYYPPTTVFLDEEEANTYPQLGNDPVAAGGSASGYLFFAIPDDKDAVRLFYSPSGHLLLLADLPAVEREAPSA
ncbi:MAG: DUF4352 domain-containing protein [Thermomicrobiales bacterium]